MKKIQTVKYEAYDGQLFNSAPECLAHETLVAELRDIFSALPKLPKDPQCKFANGEGYIQHDAQTFNAVVKRFEALVHKTFPGLKGHTVATYGFWRTLDDNDSLFYVWGQRLLNTSLKSYREYGQGYYTNHEHEARGGQLNK